MFDNILEFFRTRKIRRHSSDIPTGLMPMEKISAVNVVIDVEEPGFDILKDDILSWSRQQGLKTNIYFFDFRKLGKDELLLTSIQTTIIKKELDWIGTPDFSKIGTLMNEPSDRFISVVDNGDFPIRFLSSSAKAKFKVGRCGFPGHSYDMVMTGSPAEDLRSDSRQIFAAITEFLKKIR